MKTVALCLRVSTVDQHPETLLHDLRAMAQQRGFQIVAEYTDRISGTKARQPDLDDLLRDARRVPRESSPRRRGIGNSRVGPFYCQLGSSGSSSGACGIWESFRCAVSHCSSSWSAVRIDSWS